MKYDCSITENLICRGTDISKYFRESLGLQDKDIATKGATAYADSEVIDHCLTEAYIVAPEEVFFFGFFFSNKRVVI